MRPQRRRFAAIDLTTLRRQASELSLALRDPSVAKPVSGSILLQLQRNQGSAEVYTQRQELAAFAQANLPALKVKPNQLFGQVMAARAIQHFASQPDAWKPSGKPVPSDPESPLVWKLKLTGEEAGLRGSLREETFHHRLDAESGVHYLGFQGDSGVQWFKISNERAETDIRGWMSRTIFDRSAADLFEQS